MVIDAETNETMEFYAKIVFVNASTLGSTFLLLNSTSEAHPEGLGNGSGQLGHNLMDHHLNVGAGGTVDGYEDKYYFGRRANGIYIPRYRNYFGDKRDYINDKQNAVESTGKKYIFILDKNYIEFIKFINEINILNVNQEHAL